MKELLSLTSNTAPGFSLSCTCGKEHRVDIRRIKIADNAIEQIPEVVEAFKNAKILIIGDMNTYEAAGRKVGETLKSNGFITSEYIFKDKELIPDERALGRLIIEIHKDTELLVAVGSGSITDITRYLSFKTGIPFLAVCTAPSMDGYASVVSPLIIDGMKTTLNAVYPYGIIADLKVLSNAPLGMITAGLGDILGKYTALGDWKLSEILHGEYYCKHVADLVSLLIRKCVQNCYKIKNRELESMENLIEALLLSGIAIGMVGASRPASGEEHHLSHCWELKQLRENSETRYLHGTMVGVGVGVIAHAYKFLLTLDIKKIVDSKVYLSMNREKWISNIKASYGVNAEAVIDFKMNSISFDEEERQKRVTNIENHWQEIIQIAQSIPEPQVLIELIKQCEGTYNPQGLDIERDFFIKSVIGAKDIRNRYGVLQLLEDIGMLEAAAEYIGNKYYCTDEFRKN